MKDTISVQQIGGDLVCMHEKRIDAYKQILHASGNMKLDMKSIFERIIEESNGCVQQLKDEMDADTAIKGEVYSSWRKMQTPKLNDDRKNILETCANDELMAINTYSIALSILDDHDSAKLLEEQQRSLKKLYAHIRKFRAAQ